MSNSKKFRQLASKYKKQTDRTVKLSIVLAEYFRKSLSLPEDMADDLFGIFVDLIPDDPYEMNDVVEKLATVINLFEDNFYEPNPLSLKEWKNVYLIINEYAGDLELEILNSVMSIGVDNKFI